MWKSSLSGIIVVLVLLASSAMAQTSGSGAPDDKDKPSPPQTAAKKETADKKKSDKKTKKAKGDNKGASAETPPPANKIPPNDSASQLVTQLKTVQAQQAQKLESLRQELEVFKQQSDSTKQELESLNNEISEGKWFVLVGLAVELVALILMLLVLKFKIIPLSNLCADLVRRSDALKDQWKQLQADVLELRRGNRDLVTGKDFDGLRKAVEALQAERGVASSAWGNAKGEPQDPSWPPQPRTQQHAIRDFAAVASAQTRVTTFYADLPDRDGCFKDSSLKNKADWDSLYKLIPDSESAYAAVEIYSGSQRFEAAMKATQDYLSPVCEYQSNPPASAKTIKQVRSGRAERDGQVWRVMQKLQIEFV